MEQFGGNSLMDAPEKPDKTSSKEKKSVESVGSLLRFDAKKEQAGADLSTLFSKKANLLEPDKLPQKARSADNWLTGTPQDILNKSLPKSRPRKRSMFNLRLLANICAIYAEAPEDAAEDLEPARDFLGAYRPVRMPREAYR